MRILYIHQYFKTPEEGGAIRSYYIARGLVKAGHEVIMITSHNQEQYAYADIEGIQVHYLPVYYSNHLNNLGRSRAFLRFLRQARSCIDRFTPYDLCYVSSTPLTVGLLALYARQRYKLPYIFEVRDLWPEAPIQLGYINNIAVRSTLRKLEKHLYAKASGLVALSPGMAAGIKKAAPEAEPLLIPNMADCSFFRPEPKNEIFAKAMGLEGYFIISYLGAAGHANHLEYLLQLAQSCLQQLLPVKFLVAATGSRLNSLEEQAKDRKLENIVFVPYGSKQQVKNWLSITDAVYTSFAPYPILQTNSPNKFFDGLAAGKLSIVNTAGWLKELVEQHKCGFYINPQQPAEFITKLKPFLDNPELLHTYQQNARQLAENKFSKEMLVKQLINFIEKSPKRV